MKTPISIRIDKDLLARLKGVAPNGYQVFIHDALSELRRRRELRERESVGRAQQIFLQYHSKCFWHMHRNLKIGASQISLIQDGLRKYGGLEGLRLADELELVEKVQ